MQISKWLKLFRNFVSILLALCFVLPLSQCDIKGPEPKSTVVKTMTFQGSDMARDGWKEVKRGKAEGAATLRVELAHNWRSTGPAHYCRDTSCITGHSSLRHMRCQEA
jgi:hypothetical protein